MAPGDKEPPFLRKPQAVPRKRKRPGALRLAIVGVLALGAGVGLAEFLAGPRFALAALRRLGQHARADRGRSSARSPSGRAATSSRSISLRSPRAWPRIPGSNASRSRSDSRTVSRFESPSAARSLSTARANGSGGSGRTGASSRPTIRAATAPSTSSSRASAARFRRPWACSKTLRAERPEYFSALSEIASLPDGGFGMMDAIFRRPVRVLRADAPEKIRALLEARVFIESRGWGAGAIDLRFADRVVLVGAYGAGNSL